MRLLRRLVALQNPSENFQSCLARAMDQHTRSILQSNRTVMVLVFCQLALGQSTSMLYKSHKQDLETLFQPLIITLAVVFYLGRILSLPHRLSLESIGRRVI